MNEPITEVTSEHRAVALVEDKPQKPEQLEHSDGSENELGQDFTEGSDAPIVYSEEFNRSYVDLMASNDGVDRETYMHKEDSIMSDTMMGAEDVQSLPIEIRPQISSRLDNFLTGVPNLATRRSLRSCSLSSVDYFSYRTLDYSYPDILPPITSDEPFGRATDAIKKRAKELRRHSSMSMSNAPGYQSQLHEMYEKLMDSTQDGMASEELIREELGGLFNPDLLVRIFHVVDSENTGFVNVKTFMCGLSSCCGGSTIEKLRFCFHIKFPSMKITKATMKDTLMAFHKIVDIHSQLKQEFHPLSSKEIDHQSLHWRPSVATLEPESEIRLITDKFFDDMDTGSKGSLSFTILAHWLRHRSTHARRYVDRIVQFADITLVKRPLTAHDEKEIIANMMSKTTKSKSTDTEALQFCYILAANWWNQWKKYVNYDHTETLPRANRHKPSVIDNKPILENDEFITEEDQCTLKPYLEEGDDYVIINQDTWETLKGWYGGGPAIARRKIRNKTMSTDCRRPSMVEESHSLFTTSVSSTSTLSYIPELYPLRLWLVRSDSVGLNADLTEFFFADDIAESAIRIVRSRAETMEGLEYSVLDELELDMYQRVRLWRWDGTADIPRLLPGGPQITLEDEVLADKEYIIVDIKGEDGLWRMEFLFAEACIAPNVNASHKGSGNIGLRNLGNTCYMNSALQCLLHTLPLRDFFLSDLYYADINRKNPLGMGGELAVAYSLLIKEFWSTKSYGSVAPRNFKSTISRFASQFQGYQQQDAQELLVFLLDGLHEDLNRVVVKPYVETKDSAGRPDQEVAMESWNNHLRRHKSIIISLFQGQTKSTITCKECNHVSVTFQPYTFLSLPVPTNEDKAVDVIVVDKEGITNRCSVIVPSNGSMQNIVDAVSELDGIIINKERVLATEMIRCNHYLSDIIDFSYKLSYFNSRFITVLYDHVDPPVDYNGVETSVVMVIHRRLPTDKGDNDLEHVAPSSPEPFGWPVALEMPAEISYKDLRTILWNRVKSTVDMNGHELAEDDMMLTWSNRNGTGCGLCGWSAHCLGCPIRPTILTEESSEPSDDTDSSEEMEEYVREKENVNVAKKKHHDERYITVPDRCTIAIDWVCYPPGIDEDPSHIWEGPTPKAPRDHPSLHQTVKPITLNECLHKFSSLEDLTKDDSVYCGACKDFQPSSKQMQLWSAPPVLIIHLNRFEFNPIMMSTQKIATSITFPEKGLDLSPYLCDNSPPVCQSKRGVPAPDLYDLYGVVHHLGARAGSGHYIAYVHDKDKSRWKCFDDSYCSDCDFEEANTSAAYILFYMKRGVLLTDVLYNLFNSTSSSNGLLNPSPVCSRPVSPNGPRRSDTRTGHSPLADPSQTRPILSSTRPDPS